MKIIGNGRPLTDRPSPTRDAAHLFSDSGNIGMSWEWIVFCLLCLAFLAVIRTMLQDIARTLERISTQLGSLNERTGTQLSRLDEAASAVRSTLKWMAERGRS